jgi:hypothetical protein
LFKGRPKLVLPFSFTYDMHIPLQQSWNFERPKKFVISKFTNRKAKVVQFCYENKHINRLKSVRYENYIPTWKGESGSMDLPFFGFQDLIFSDFDLTPDSPIRYGPCIQIVSVIFV